jgi:hypothetical protein
MPSLPTIIGSATLGHPALRIQSDGDNLLAIHDEDVATVFAIEALVLVDHFDILDRSFKGPKSKQKASKHQAAMDAEWVLSTDDKWVQKYFDSSDLHSVGSATLSLIFFASRSLDSPLDDIVL